MPKKKQVFVPVIFEKFVFSLGALIREKVAESIQAATYDFFTGHRLEKAPVAKAEKKPRKKRGSRRGRKKGSKNKTVNAAKPTPAEKPAQE